MTEQTEETAGYPSVVVIPDAESRLAQLHAAYADAKAKADEAAAQLKVITDGIKAELQGGAHDGVHRFELRSPHGPALSLQCVESWRLDSKKLKADKPLVYVTYAKKSSSWTLRPLRSSGGDDE